MKKITFKFKDELSNGKWIKRTCVMSSLDECIRVYGLDHGLVEWELISIENTPQLKP